MTACALSKLRPNQAAMWAGQKLAGDVGLYNMAIGFRIAGALDPNRFRAAFDDVVRDQVEMNTVYEGFDGTPRLGAPKPFPVPVDFSAEDDPDAVAEAWMAQRTARTIDLALSSWDSCLIKLSEESWIWFFNQHHIATDASSFKVLFDAVSERYLGRAFDIPARGPEAKPDKVAEAHWATRVQLPKENTTPYARQRDSSVSTSRRIEHELSAEMSSNFKDLASSPGFRAISPDLARFAVLASAFAGFLHRVTGNQVIQIGAPAHGRGTPAEKAMLGCFIDLFPLRIEVDEADTFRSLHRKFIQEALTFLRHAKPGTGSGELAGTYNAVLNYIPMTFGEFAGMPVKTRWFHSGAHDPGHDLRLHVHDFDDTGRLTLAFDLNDAVFDDVHCAPVMGHFLAILETCLRDPEVEISKIDLGGVPVLAGKAEPELPETIFEQLFSQDAERIAVSEGETSLTYGAFRARVSAYAAGFANQGTSRGDAVLIHGVRSIELVAAFWGAMLAGAVVVPVPAFTPANRVQDLADASGARIGYLDEITSGVISLEAVQPSAEGFDGKHPVGSNAAYTIFTSGSTGMPKGVVVEHEALLRYADWAGREHIGDFALHTSIGFDLTITSLVAPLLHGHAIRVYPDETATDLSVLDVFAEDAVDVVKLTPSHLSLVLEQGVRVKRISTLILGGEALSSSLALRAASLGDTALTISNEYGPTEAVVGAMLQRFDPMNDHEPTVSIGTPADGVEIAVLDKGHNPVPFGVTGEICIAGRLARGYLGNDILTQERFAMLSGKRYYRSGDLAQVRPDGRVAYLGRADAQIKVGGVRIEPAEIEAVVARVPGVARVHVAAVPMVRPFDPDAHTCAQCGISADVPDVSMDESGVCSICRGFEGYRARADVYFEAPENLRSKLAELRNKRQGRFDAIMLLSGGKDSTYALYRLAELTQDILCLTLDNGFLSERAKANIRAVADDLGLEHRFMTTPAMNAIFRDSLARHSNVCQGCFKTIYTLALRIAREEAVPAIVTGLSRGQFFETRLTPELFETKAPAKDEIERFVKQARYAYHKIDDAVSTHLNTTDLHDPEILEDIEFIDLYRYIDAPVSEIYRFLDARAWKRPDDTGRSTNCRINDLGIYVHTKREGFHNYAIPYSWDVRMGHKTRDEAVDELHDDIDATAMQEMMSEIGLDPNVVSERSRPKLVAYFTGSASRESIEAELARSLPANMTPTHIVSVESIPLTPNGKVDTARLPLPAEGVETPMSNVPPGSPTERALEKSFGTILGLHTVGVTDNFYAIGGDSIAAIRIALDASESGLALAATDIFEHQTIRALAAYLDERGLAPIEQRIDEGDDTPLISLGSDDFAALSVALAAQPVSENEA